MNYMLIETTYTLIDELYDGLCQMKRSRAVDLCPYPRKGRKLHESITIQIGITCFY